MTEESTQPLSERELEIVRLVATGATNAQIARELFISPNTVKVHLRNIFAKLGVASRTEAIMVALQRGWVTVPAGGAVAAGGGALPEATVAPVPVQRLPLGQRAYLVIAALVCLALLFGTWPSADARGCSPGVESERCGAAAPAVGDSRWTTRALMPTARGRLALAALPDPRGGAGGRLIAIGGEGEAGVTAEVEIFDPARNAWQMAAAKPTAASNVSAAVLAGHVYVPGGSTGGQGVSSVLEIYDPTADAWTSGPPMPAPRAGYALAALDGRLYVIGGWDGQRYVADTLVFDAQSLTWTQGKRLPTARAFAAAAVLQGWIYVVGGYDGEHEFDTCERYDPSRDGWESCAPLGLARGGLGVGVILDRLYVVGGGWTRVLAYSERYDAATNSWTRFETPLSTQWRNMGVAVLDGDLYAVGGWDGQRYLGTVEQYQALYKTYLPTTKH